MNIKNTTSMLAVLALLGATGAAFANGTSTYDAAVSVLSPDQTGFIIGGQVSVNGLGSGSVSLSRSAAEMSVTGSADSGLSRINNNFWAPLMGVDSSSAINSSVVFSRDVNTAGSLVGVGGVTARGEAIASMGTAGAASANTTTAGTNGVGSEGSANSSSSSQGSLNGSLSTANSLQLLGTSGLFAGSNGLNVGETNTAVAYGASDISADTWNNGISLSNVGTNEAGNGLLTGTGNGALFNVTTSLHNNQNPIQLAVSNAGNGTISVTTSTGGFFTGGGATGGSSAMADSGNFFWQP